MRYCVISYAESDSSEALRLQANGVGITTWTSGRVDKQTDRQTHIEKHFNFLNPFRDRFERCEAARFSCGNYFALSNR
jgi:hypothetical protein